MPKRDEKMYEERKQQIIDGALRVFAEKGFEEATNKEIADAAGVGSPGLLYHYFKDKAELFREAVESRMPLLQLIAHPEELLELPPREMLLRLGSAYLEMFDRPQSVALFKLILAEAIRREEIATIIRDIGPNRALKFLAAYLQKQMDAGALRQVNPAHAARCFLSPLITYVLTREVFLQEEALHLDPSDLLETTIDLFLCGLKAE